MEQGLDQNQSCNVASSSMLQLPSERSNGRSAASHLAMHLSKLMLEARHQAAQMQVRTCLVRPWQSAQIFVPPYSLLLIRRQRTVPQVLLSPTLMRAQFESVPFGGFGFKSCLSHTFA